jgi:hypothetical protein
METFLKWFSSDRERREALILEIESAFAEVTKRSGMGIRETALYVDSHGVFPSTLNADLQTARSLDEQPWRDIPLELLRDFALLEWTDTQGFKYLLPAHLRYWLVRVGNNPGDDMFPLFLNSMERSWFSQDGLQFSSEQVVCLYNFCAWTNEHLA